MNTLLIGLGSKAQIGKDFAAIGLKKYFDVERVSFADQLKEDLNQVFLKHNLNFLELIMTPELKKKLRPLMIEYGQALREFNPDVWVNAALLNKQFNHQVTIITDVRFPNEAKRIKQLGGYYIEILADVPPANEVEAHYSPIMETLADFKVRNNFDENYILAMEQLVRGLLVNKEL